MTDFCNCCGATCEDDGLDGYCDECNADRDPSPRIRYLISPPRGFCAAFVVWAESPELALAYGAQWLGRPLPGSTFVLRFLTHDKLSCMYVGHDGHQPTHTNTTKKEVAA